MIYISSDHRGFSYKQRIVAWFDAKGLQYKDLGPLKLKKTDDYPDYAKVVARAVAKAPARHLGILLCGSGIGMSVAANKFADVRAGICLNEKMAFVARNDDYTNVLVLPADFVSLAVTQRIIRKWLDTPFSHLRRHTRRINKIKRIEKTWLQ